MVVTFFTTKMSNLSKQLIDLGIP